MSISEKSLIIRELLNNSRKEQRISYLEVLSEIISGIFDLGAKPKLTADNLVLKPIYDNVGQSIADSINSATPEQIEAFLKLFPNPKPGMLVSLVPIRKDRTRLSENIREFYKTIGEPEEDDIVYNRKIFLKILEQYGFIEKMDIENTKFYKFMLEYAEEIGCMDEEGEFKINKIEDIRDDGFREIFGLAGQILGEDYIKRELSREINIEVGNYYVYKDKIVELSEFLNKWNGVSNYSTQFDFNTGILKYCGNEVEFKINENPYFFLRYLYSTDRVTGIDLEEVYIQMSNISRWNKRFVYDQGGKVQIDNVIKSINRAFKKKFPNEKLIQNTGSKAVLLI